jgi:hypothetical protein
MPRDDNSQDVVFNGRLFKRVKMGLDEKEVLPFIQTIIEERDELSKRLDNSPTLMRFVEKIAKEADEWAEQTKKEARDQASTDAQAILLKAEEQAAKYAEEKRIEAKEQATADSKAIISRAEDQAAKYIEEKRKEATATSQKEAEFLKRQAQIRLEAWVKEIKDNLIIQLRDIGGLLNREMRAQAEELKRRAVAFESDFEKQLTDLKKREITVSADRPQESPTKTGSENLSVAGQKTAAENQKQAAVPPMIVEAPPKERQWVEVQVASGEPDEVKALKTRLEQQSEIGAAQVTRDVGKTTISVLLRKPIDVIQKLMSFPEVKQAQEIVENEEIIYRVVLAKAPPKENMKDILSEQLRDWNIKY